MPNRFRFPLFFLFLIVIVLGGVVLFPGAVRETPEDALREVADKPNVMVDLKNTVERLGISVIVKLNLVSSISLDLWDHRATALTHGELDLLRQNLLALCVLACLIFVVTILAFIFFMLGLFLTTALFSLLSFFLHVALLVLYFARLLGTYHVLVSVPVSTLYDVECIGMHLYIVATALSFFIAVLSMINYCRPLHADPLLFSKGGDPYSS